MPPCVHLQPLTPSISSPLSPTKSEVGIRCQESASDLLCPTKYLRSHLTRHRRKEKERRERERPPKISLAINSGAREGREHARVPDQTSKFRRVDFPFRRNEARFGVESSTAD